MGVGEEIYSGAAQFGRIWTYLGAIIASVLAVVMIGFGLYLLFLRLTQRQTAGMAMEDSKEHVDKDGKKLYTTPISWTVGASEYHATLTGESALHNGQSVTIYYGMFSPRSGSLEPISWTAPAALISGAIFIALVAWAWVYITRRYKFVAAATGVSDVYRLLK